MHKTGSYTFRLWRTANFRGIEKHTSYKITLGIISYQYLRQVVERAKNMMKGKIDRQLAEQSSSTPFMSTRDTYNKNITFDTRGRLEDKIDKLKVMMGKLAKRDNGTNRQFKPQIYQSKRRGQSKNFYDTCNYDRGNYQNRYRSNSRDRRFQFGGQSRGRLRYEQNYKRGNFRGNIKFVPKF